jgi:hypothetical protein
MPSNASPIYPSLSGGIISTATGTFAQVTVSTAPNDDRPVRAVIATVQKGTAPGITAGNVITYVVNADNSITFFIWSPTSVSNPQLIAAVATTTFSWLALHD